MKGTISEKAIPELFYGKMKSYIKCINVEYESAREDDFSGEIGMVYTAALVLINLIRYTTEC